MSISEMQDAPELGIVIIGRNEGERLRQSLLSVHNCGYITIYVDSGSTDGSVELAKKYCSQVVELDPQRPFSAARARNEGLGSLRRMAPQIGYVQFLDGDCTLEGGWLTRAYGHIAGHDDTAIVCGHLRERHATSTLYTQLCELEWRGDVGEIDACGGIFMGRISALQTVGMFNEAMIAGEEPELCHRLRADHWKIERIDAPMAVHDSDISKVSQLLQRARRCGHSYAHSHYIHRTSSASFKQRNLLSVLFWGGLLPLLVIGLIPFSTLAAAATTLLYALLWLKIYVHGITKTGISAKLAAANSSYIVLGKFAQLVGVIEFYWNLWQRKDFELIEYK